MSDLISRCALFNKLATVQTLGEAYGVIQGMETVDAVPVVRCKDCKHWQDYNGDHFVLQNCSRNNHVMKHGNDYCSWAERKDGENGRS